MMKYLILLCLSLSSLGRLHSQCAGDMEDPVSNCDTIHLVLGHTMEVSLNPVDYHPFFSDNCGVDSVWVSEGRSVFYCSDLDSTLQVTLMVSDSAGNTTSCLIPIKLTAVDTQSITNELLFWTEEFAEEFNSYNLTKSAYSELLDNLVQPFGIAENKAKNSIFVAAYNMILEVDFFGTIIDTIVGPNDFIITGIDVDPSLGQIYFVEARHDSIFRVDFDGSDLTSLISTDEGGSGDYALKLDTASQKIYWSDYGLIRRCDYDGSEAEVFLSAGGTVVEFDVDYDNGRIFWANSTLKKIQQSSFISPMVEDVFTLTETPYGLELDLAGNRVFWTTASGVHFSDTTGSNITTLVSSQYGARFIELFEVQTTDTINPCNQSPVANSLDTLNLYVDDICSFVIVADSLNDGSSDPDADSLSFSVSSEGPFGPGTHLVTFYVDDGMAYDSSYTTVVVKDTTPPNLQCISDSIWTLDADGMLQVNASAFVTNIMDPCGYDLDSLMASQLQFDTLDLGANIIEISLPDFYQNRATCEVEITLVHHPEYLCTIDEIPPATKCDSLTISLDSTGTGVLSNESFSGVFSDSCGIDSLWFESSRTEFYCSDLDSVFPVAVFAKDPAGNMSSCTVQVRISAFSFHPAIFVAADGDVGVLDLITLQYQTLNTQTTLPLRVRSNANKDMVLMTNGNAIHSITNDNFNFDTIFVSDSILIRTFEVDWTNQHIYFVGLGTTYYYLCRIDLDGSNFDLLNSLESIGTSDPHSMDLHVSDGHIYWTDLMQKNIQRCDLDGTNIEEFRVFGIGEGRARSIVVDEVNSMIYWTNDELEKLQTCGIVDTAVLDVLNGIPNNPNAVTLDPTGTKLYWTNEHVDFISGHQIHLNDLSTSDTAMLYGGFLDIFNISFGRLPVGSINPCNSAPVASCIDTTIYALNECEITLNPNDLDSSSYDPDGDNLTFTLEPSGPFGLGIHEVLMIVADGNTSDTCISTVSILDTIPPQVTCRNDTTIHLPGSGQLSVSSIAFILNSSDNCSNSLDSIIPNELTFNTSDVGPPIPVVLQGYDTSGNSSSCQLNISIVQAQLNQPPTAICDTINVYVDDACGYTIDTLALAGDSFDPDGDTLSFSLDKYFLFEVGLHEVEVIVSDGEYADTCFAWVELIDTIPPTLTCRDTTYSLDENALLSIWIEDLPIHLDNGCIGYNYDSVAISQFEFSCQDIGLDTLIVSVFDSAGNIATCYVAIEIVGPDDDMDGVANCADACPNNPNKTVQGQCGCTTNEVDSDGDGTPDCDDECPNDPLKILQGDCGCSQVDTDSDSDGVSDCLDFCPNDPNKIFSGACGCGVADLDNDNDGVLNCQDGCPEDSLKVAPGENGCGVMDTNPPDADMDGVPDSQDGCPFDPNKTSPGTCGCGVTDDTPDSDGDGLSDCLDACPNDPNKITPGACGCGVVDIDSDGDGAADCIDQCPNDPNKVLPGVCGCGVSNEDSDGDGIRDCLDGCPIDPLKIAPGTEGCGNVDPVPPDTDSDGTIDSQDNCPLDPNKVSPGICGCGVVDSATDSDGDGVRDCLDGCPQNPLKSSPNGAGCFSPCSDFNVMMDQTLMQNTTEISSTWINASGDLMAQKVYLQAGNFITLDPGFLVQAGTDMAANIEACVGGISMHSFSFQQQGSATRYLESLTSTQLEFRTQETLTWDLLSKANLHIVLERPSKVTIEFYNTSKGTFGFLMYEEFFQGGELEVMLRNNADEIGPFDIRIKLDEQQTYLYRIQKSQKRN